MRTAALLIAVIVTVFPFDRSAVAQVQELPMVPMATGGWQEKFWTHSDGTKFHYFEMGTGTTVILIHGSGGTALKASRILLDGSSECVKAAPGMNTTPASIAFFSRG